VSIRSIDGCFGLFAADAGFETTHQGDPRHPVGFAGHPIGVISFFIIRGTKTSGIVPCFSQVKPCCATPIMVMAWPFTVSV